MIQRQAFFKAVSRVVQGLLLRAAMALVSVGVALLVLEVGVRLFVQVTDNIDYTYLPGVGIRLVPKQAGVFVRDGIHGAFRVNEAGFNNAHTYTTRRIPGVHRVAVVGDSFIEALHVNQGQALFDVLERQLNADQVPSEVYSFGVSGFGTAQIYHLVTDYVLPYSPDAVVYLFIINDVADSARCAGENPWYQQYDLAPDGSLVKLPFGEYRMSPIKRMLRFSHLFQYVVYQRRLLERWRPARWQAFAYSDGTTVDPCIEKAWKIAEGLLVNLDSALKQQGVPWLLMWQGDTDPSYGKAVRTRLEDIVQRRRLPYFDTSAAFAADHAIHAKPYRIAGDGHWNAAGHQVAGTALAPIVEHLLSARSPS